MAKAETKKVRTSRGLREYTYLGCPNTRNRSAWCFRLCSPDADGHGDCGRVAPHSLRSRIQESIETYDKEQLEAHLGRLERMYLAAPSNERYDPGISLSEGEAEIVIPIQDEFLHDAGSVHAAICFKAMDDAARLAVNSKVRKFVISTAAFNINLTRPIASGELIARGRLVTISDDDYVAESVLIDSSGVEIGRGIGKYVKSSIPLSAEIGYS